MKTLLTTAVAVLSASLIACGGGSEPEYVHCPDMFHAAYLVETDGTEHLLTDREQSPLDDDLLAEIAYRNAAQRNLQGDVHVGGWCNDE